MVVEDQRSALREVELVGEREREELGGDGDLSPAAERTEGGDALPLAHRGTGGRAEDHAADLAAGDERQRRFHLVLAACLQKLGEGDAGGVHLDEHAFPGGQHVRGLGLGDLDERERAVGTCLLHDLDGSHGG